MSDLAAIDILINPDAATVGRALTKGRILIGLVRLRPLRATDLGSLSSSSIAGSLFAT
jgi:hypothetical protein